MPRLTSFVSTILVINAAATQFALAQLAPAIGSSTPGATQSDAEAFCPTFLRSPRAAQIAERTAERFGGQKPQWDSSSALTFLRNQLSSGLQSELTSVADTAAIRSLTGSTIIAVFPASEQS